MYKTNDSSCPTSDWVSLNFDAIPTSVIQALYRESMEDLARVHEECSVCEGIGEALAPGATDDTDIVECVHCEGTGAEPDDAVLYDWPAAHGHMWTCEDRPEHRTALLESGFVVYTDESREGYFDGLLIVGIDGGGYSFRGQHWIPLRAFLAKHSAEFFADLHSKAEGGPQPVLIDAALRAFLVEEASREGEARRIERIFGV